MKRFINRRSFLGLSVASAAIALADIRSALAAANKVCGEKCQGSDQCASGVCCEGRCLCCGGTRKPVCVGRGSFCCPEGQSPGGRGCNRKRYA